MSSTTVPGMTGQPIVKVRGLWSRFGTLVVHKNLDFDLYPGEIVSIVGGSGSGKTTLVRQILGLETPRKGSIEVFGQSILGYNPASMANLRRRSGVMFQHGALYSALPVIDNVAMPLRELRTFDEDFIRHAALFKLNMVGISAEHAYKMPSELSGGMVKRVALARALILDPELVFLDEPTAGLDPDRSDSFVKLIQTLHRELNLTVVMITHDLDTLFELSSRIVVLADKTIVVQGNVHTVLANTHPFVQHYFWGSRAQRAIQVLPEFKPEAQV